LGAGARADRGQASLTGTTRSAAAKQAAAAKSAAAFIPPNPTIERLRQAAAGCTACPLYAGATQTVFGEGPSRAKVMLVGETPGDQEDRQGHPFVGPAGALLDRCLATAGIDRDAAYVSNVVKHFKWTPRGKRRLHAKPNAMEIRACKPWIGAEIGVVKPKVLICLGATATQALLGPQQKVTQIRGRFVQSALAPYVMATVHPSSLLRATDDDVRRAEIEKFIKDLRKAAEAIE
jgi:DNA polymerase